MQSELLDFLPLWAFFLASAAIIWMAMEAGFRLGRWRHFRAPEEKDSAIGSIVGSILGLLGFMMAFTFGLAASRFDERRQVVLEESNAIGTAYLRTRLLPEPYSKEVAGLLREYVDLRLVVVGENFSHQSWKAKVALSEDLQEKIWSQTMAAAEKQPTVLTGLFVQALNQMIDVHAKRIMVGTRGRIPISIWLGLFFLALLGMGTAGYQVGLAEVRRSFAMGILVLAFAGVLLMIADLDRPWAGLLRTSQDSMIDLQRSMKKPS